MDCVRETLPKGTLRTVFIDPKYLTLHKLLALVNAALLLHGVPIYDYDLIRWVHEGLIPLHGAYQLLPSSVNLGAHGKKILGGAARGESAGPSLFSLRQTTARMLRHLNITEIPKPPIRMVAARVIEDLQLPGYCFLITP